MLNEQLSILSMIKKLSLKDINFPILFLSILPISIVLGPTISLINIIIISLFYFFQYFKNEKVVVNDIKAIISLLILYIYLVFNTLISIDPTSGLGRNIGFIRFVFFFLSINFIFFKFKNSKNIFKAWTIVLVILIFDIYVERITGSNLFGFGKTQIDGVLQPHGMRIVSFFKTEPIAGAFVTGFIFIVSGYLIDSFKKRKIKNNYIIFATTRLYWNTDYRRKIKYN